MKWLRICALLIATLVAMRLGSWAIGWVIAKLARLRPRAVSIIANSVALAVFAFLLVRNLVPGEPVDYAALLFGLVVFAVYCVTDFYWSPWRLKA